MRDLLFMGEKMNPSKPTQGSFFPAWAMPVPIHASCHDRFSGQKTRPTAGTTLHAGADMVEWAPPGAMPAGVNDAGDDGHRMEKAWRGQVLGLLPGPNAPGMKPRRGEATMV